MGHPLVCSRYDDQYLPDVVGAEVTVCVLLGRCFAASFILVTASFALAAFISLSHSKKYSTEYNDIVILSPTILKDTYNL